MTRRIHDGLVGRRELVGTDYLADPELRRQYAREIAPRTGAALARIFAEAAPPRVARVLDLGAGTGAAGAAVRARFGAGVEVVAVDRVAAPGVIVADVAARVRPAGVHGRFDLVVAAHLLNELPLPSDGRANLVAGWCDELLEAQGLCVILEPALRETSRALLELRDRLIARGLFVVAPCFFQGPCPALVRERDFCHDAAPPIAERRSRVDFSHLVLRRSGVAERDPAIYRVVSDRLQDKGRLRVFGCGPAGRHELVRLRRDRSAANAALDRVERGDVVRVAEAPRIGAATEVTFLRRSRRGT